MATEDWKNNYKSNLYNIINKIRVERNTVDLMLQMQNIEKIVNTFFDVGENITLNKKIYFSEEFLC